MATDRAQFDQFVVSRWPGLVRLAFSSRTAYAVAYLSDGSDRRLRPRLVGGRRYIGVAVLKPERVTSLVLYDGAGTRFAHVASMPTSCGVVALPACR